MNPTDSPQSAASESGSTMFGVSIRAWLAVMLVSTVCAMAVMSNPVDEPLYSLSIMSVGFYFGQKVKAL